MQALLQIQQGLQTLATEAGLIRVGLFGKDCESAQWLLSLRISDLMAILFGFRLLVREFSKLKMLLLRK